MAIKISDYMTNGGAVAHGFNGGQVTTITGTVRLPSGYTPTDGDFWLFNRLPEGAIVQRILVRSPALGANIDCSVGYVRPVVNPALPYNATTNPYIDNAIGTADPDFFEGSVEAPFAAGGLLELADAGFTVQQAASGFAGDVDVCIEVINTGTVLSADADVKITMDVLFNDEQPQGEFSGASAYDYQTNYDI
jgi:hypothetical protein